MYIENLNIQQNKTVHNRIFPAVSKNNLMTHGVHLQPPIYLYSEVTVELLREIPTFTNIQSGEVTVLLTNANVIHFCLLSVSLRNKIWWE